MQIMYWNTRVAVVLSVAVYVPLRHCWSQQAYTLVVMLLTHNYVCMDTCINAVDLLRAGFKALLRP